MADKEYKSPLKHNDLLRQANALQKHLPFYLQHENDLSASSGLDPEQVKDGYGECHIGQNSVDDE